MGCTMVDFTRVFEDLNDDHPWMFWERSWNLVDGMNVLVGQTITYDNGVVQTLQYDVRSIDAILRSYDIEGSDVNAVGPTLFESVTVTDADAAGGTSTLPYLEWFRFEARPGLSLLTEYEGLLVNPADLPVYTLLSVTHEDGVWRQSRTFDGVLLQTHIRDTDTPGTSPAGGPGLYTWDYVGTYYDADGNVVRTDRREDDGTRVDTIFDVDGTVRAKEAFDGGDVYLWHRMVHREHYRSGYWSEEYRLDASSLKPKTVIWDDHLPRLVTMEDSFYDEAPWDAVRIVFDEDGQISSRFIKYDWAPEGTDYLRQYFKDGVLHFSTHFRPDLPGGPIVTQTFDDQGQKTSRFIDYRTGPDRPDIYERYVDGGLTEVSSDNPPAVYSEFSDTGVLEYRRTIGPNGELTQLYYSNGVLTKTIVDTRMTNINDFYDTRVTHYTPSGEIEKMIVYSGIRYGPDGPIIVYLFDEGVLEKSYQYTNPAYWSGSGPQSNLGYRIDSTYDAAGRLNEQIEYDGNIMKERSYDAGVITESVWSQGYFSETDDFYFVQRTQFDLAGNVTFSEKTYRDDPDDGAAAEATLAAAILDDALNFV